FERSLRKILQEGDVDDITDTLTPRALSKCSTNALLMAMEASFELRRLAGKKGPDEEDFTKLANSVDEFTSCLLDPLKSNTESRHAFGDSLDYLLDAGIELEQKKFFAHPVMYNLMKKKWFGSFGKMKKSSWLELGWWKWIVLNIWCLFDIVLFPFLFTTFSIKDYITKATRRSKEMYLVFIISATSDVADQAFELTKNTMKYLLRNYKNHKVKYHILIHEEDATTREMCFTEELSDKVDELTRNSKVNIPVLHEVLDKVGPGFTLCQGNRTDAEKVLVFFTDHKICLKRQYKEFIEKKIQPIKEMGVKIVPVGIGSHIDIRELEKINSDGRKVMHFGEYANPKIVGKSVSYELYGKDLVESYREYFTTPYFVFIRDTLSYLVLLGLLVALCLESSTIPFSGLEWAILVFFLGRILMESRQFLDVKVRPRRLAATKDFRGSKYQIYSETEEEIESSPTRGTPFLQRYKKYLSDRWNILDFITLVNYIVTLVVRVVTWSLSESVTGNRALVIAEYLYGLNTMFLTLRAFGHVMETFKGIGAIQIALFQIIGDVVTIFWQFIATILAFSIAITKVYIAERSFISKTNEAESMGPNLVKEVPVELAILADFWKAKWVKEGDPNIFNYTLKPFLKNIGIAFHRNLPKRPPLHNGLFILSGETIIRHRFSLFFNNFFSLIIVQGGYVTLILLKKIIRPIRSERGVNFAPKFPPFIGACSLQRYFADIQRGRFFSKCFSHKKCEKHLGNWSGIVSFVLLSMKKTVESRQNNSGSWWSMMQHLTWSLLGIAELDTLDSVDSASVTLANFLFGAFLIMGVILLVNMMIALLSNTYQRVEENSLKEWSFKKAITIETYSTYHPIPVPFNLISHLFLWLKWLCCLCRRCKRQPREKPLSKRSYSLDDVVENLQFTYFSCHGYSFPLTDERKMDYVLQETQRNRQLANHIVGNQIAYRTFAANGVNDGVFTTGPKAWQSQGIRIQGCLLICEGSEFCSTCKDDPKKYHGARYIFPFSPDCPHFEVLIQETGEQRLLGVGIVGKDYGNHSFPGRENGSVGYLIDDGRILDAENPTWGIACDDAMAYRGDLISCTVNFELARDGKVPIVFSLNGRQITQNKIFMDYTQNEESLYPYVGMGQTGIRVLAKVSTR
ncbi:unnamed protein product, partial [Porites lobata]